MNLLTPIATSLLIITVAPLLHAQPQGQETAGDEKARGCCSDCNRGAEKQR